ncbi:hypothetical protein BCV70DRAFT_165711 [Testicularia cyperi]|uniref:Protein kinase domain-containing protein n=1 Tax=Testicularia cyperi TaxID=1882483 RepID=A0A317XI89_9BASI|nr:hypothetical protein BCV70DRAFT_165711 [Testicularia cyperi]
MEDLDRTLEAPPPPASSEHLAGPSSLAPSSSSASLSTTKPRARSASPLASSSTATIAFPTIRTRDVDDDIETPIPERTAPSTATTGATHSTPAFASTSPFLASRPSSSRTSRSSSRAPSPIRTLSQTPHSTRASPSATVNVNATGSAISSLTITERDQISQKLKSHPAATATAATATTSKDNGMLQTANASPYPHAHPSSAAGPSTHSSKDMPAPTYPSYRRSQSHRFERATSTASGAQGHSPQNANAATAAYDNHASSSSRPYTQSQHTSTEMQEKERQRLRAAAAAKLAEQEAWEKTRGAGSAVLDLLKSTDDSDDNSADSGGERQSRSTTPGSTTPGSGTGSGSGSQLSSGEGDSNGSHNSSSNSSRSVSRRQRTSAMQKRPRDRTWEAWQVLPSLEDVQTRHHEAQLVSSADKLLSRGISEYTILPKILGRGKFSSVFLASKPYGPAGEPRLFAVKHTPLFSHHPLIATRLLREPTLLAELAPHPNLVNVYETIRTPGHFYLVEEYLGGYVTLEALLPMRSEQSPPNLPILPTGVANCVLDQLLAAVHAIHHPLQICHRDIKPENILVHPDTLQLKLLDFGLATHFSRSEPKLSTCCGSPAFHCPEIVTALRNPLGTVRYWGPEVDAWTCGVTMLRLLTGVRYPIGASHSSVRSMAIKAQRAVATIQDPELRDRVGKLLEINGERRMRNFEQLVTALEQDRGEPQREPKEFKSTTFIPAEPQHKMNLPLVVGPAAEAALVSPVLPSGATPSGSSRTTPMGSRATSPVPSGLCSSAAGGHDVSDLDVSPAPSLLLSNPTIQPPQRVLSYIKYCLRSAGILYHCWPDTSSSASQPGTPGPFETAFQEYNAVNGHHGSSTNLLSAGTGGNANAGPVPTSSPTTPFPLQAARSERDPYSHIHVFECVLEIVDEPEPEEEAPATLVQSIFSALTFGRRPANRRSLSQPPKPDFATINQTRGGMPQPPGTPANAPVSGSGAASGKPGDVNCLTFYLVVRFPRKPNASVSFVHSRPGYSRSSSLAGHSHQSRSRASSTVALDRMGGGLHRDASTDSLTGLSKLHSSNAEFVSGIHPRRKAMIDSNHTTPRASRTASPSLAYNSLKKRERDGSLEEKPHGTDLGLTIETSPELLRIAEAQARGEHAGLHPSSSSAPNSRATSRARSRKSSRARASSTSLAHRLGGSNKVFVHVSDRRAVDAVRRALGIGGTTADYNPDSEPEPEDLLASSAWLSPALRSRELVVDEGPESGSEMPTGSSKPMKRPPHHRLEHGEERRGRAGTKLQIADADGGFGNSNSSASPTPTWVEVPKGTYKPRSTISHGSDDGEQFTRGRQLGPAGALSSPGIPFPAQPHRLRAPSNLSFAVVQEESSPSNTEHSASQSKTMLDLRHQPSNMGTASAITAGTVVASSTTPSLDLAKTVTLILNRVYDALQKGAVGDEFLEEVSERITQMDGYLSSLQRSNVARLTGELDSLSFDLIKALSPLLGIVTSADGTETEILTTTRRILEVLADHASSRELYMAIDMRCSEMLREAMPESATKHFNGQINSNISWLAVSETIQLMRLLTSILPRIRTKKPSSFSSVFGALPRSLALGLASAASVAPALAEKLAADAVLSCCSTAITLVDWEAGCVSGFEREPSKKTSREALERFLTGVTSCLPHLAGFETPLSEEFFLSESPQYAIARARDGGTAALPLQQQQQQRRQSVVRENEAVFAEISKTLASLDVDLAFIWSTSLQSMSHGPEGDDVRQVLSTLGVGGFVLHTCLLASGYARDKPADWKGVRAQTQLETALPLVLLALTGQTKAAAQPDLEEGREDALADTSLLWMQWCFAGMRSDEHLRLQDDLAISLAQTLATQTVISPSPMARLIRFRLLTDLLTKRTQPTTATEVLEELVTASPFSQLRAGAVSILRSIVSQATPVSAEKTTEAEPVAGAGTELEESDAVDDSEQPFWVQAGSSFPQLLDRVFCLPAGCDAGPDAGVNEHGPSATESLVSNADQLAESLSLLYTLQTRRLSSSTTDLQRWSTKFVQPLRTLIRELSPGQQQQQDSHVSQTLQLLSLSLDRLSL